MIKTLSTGVIQGAISLWQAPLVAAALGTAAEGLTQKMAPDHPLGGLFAQHSQEIAVLAVSGVAGAMASALWNPKEGWRTRLRFGLADSLSAMFVGGGVAIALTNLTTISPFYAFMSAGFLMGVFGPSGIEFIRQWLKRNAGEAEE